jgi:hypothetical protein
MLDSKLLLRDLTLVMRQEYTYIYLIVVTPAPRIASRWILYLLSSSNNKNTHYFRDTLTAFTLHGCLAFLVSSNTLAANADKCGFCLPPVLYGIPVVSQVGPAAVQYDSSRHL